MRKRRINENKLNRIVSSTIRGYINESFSNKRWEHPETVLTEVSQILSSALNMVHSGKWNEQNFSDVVAALQEANGYIWKQAQSGNRQQYESRKRSRMKRLREGMEDSSRAISAVKRIAPQLNVQDAYLLGDGYVICVNGKYNYLDIYSGEIEFDTWYNSPQEVENIVRQNDIRLR